MNDDLNKLIDWLFIFVIDNEIGLASLLFFTIALIVVTNVKYVVKNNLVKTIVLVSAPLIVLVLFVFRSLYVVDDSDLIRITESGYIDDYATFELNRMIRYETNKLHIFGYDKKNKSSSLGKITYPKIKEAIKQSKINNLGNDNNKINFKYSSDRAERLIDSAINQKYGGN